MLPDKLFFIYVAKNEEWQRLQAEDWGYVSAMTRFYHWWAKRYFGIDMPVEADILPIVPGKLFDRMSLAYLLRDHEDRGKDTYHFYLAYFKPFFTDCNTEGYTTENFGMIFWRRPKEHEAEPKRYAYFAEENCPKVSHVLAHELLRLNGKKRDTYVTKVHKVWTQHVEKDRPFLHFDSQFRRTGSESFKFATLDPSELV